MLSFKQFNEAKSKGLTIPKVRRKLYSTAKTLGDVNAISKGKVGKRIGRRVAGKVTGRLLGKLFK